jgi:tight adherence protein C
MSPVVVTALAAGAAVGLGIWLLVRELVPAAPALGPALRQLQAPSAASRFGDRSGDHDLADQVARWVRIPHQDLALTGSNPQRYATELLGFALVGLVFPPLFSLILALSGIRLPIVVPALAGVALGLLLAFLAHVSVRQRAATAREVFARHVAVYLDLIALELAASRGPVEALERAAAVGDGWVAQRIRQTLANSRLHLQPPWEGLRQVAAEIGVPDLGDVGDMMTLLGDEGARVYDTLRARAHSIRAALLARDEDRANTATTALYIPTSLLVFVLFVIAAYPFLVRMIST